MKLESIVKLVELDEVHDFVQGMWKTDIFRKSHMEHGFVHSIVDSFASMPSFFFRASDEHLEKAHFATWWRGIQIRDYDNDYVHDLYLLHEMWHAGDMIFANGLCHDEFKRKMQDNELGASVCSEIEIYFRLPGLREKTFPEEIYADRFIESDVIQQRWAKNPDRIVREFRMYRQNAMMKELPVDHPDRPEYWIRQFVEQNEDWANVWKDKFVDVEAALVRMRKSVDAGKKHEALENHINWLLSDEIAQGTGVPFPEEADNFAQIYWRNKNAYTVDHSPKKRSLAAEFPAPANV